MNSVNENKPESIAEVVEAVRMAIGNENVKVCDGGCGCGDAGVCVTPKNADEVSKVVAIAKKNNVKVVSSNNPSWATDGTRHAKGGVLIDLSKIDGIVKIDAVSMSVRAGAGCDFKTLIEACEKEGFTLGSYPFDRSSTVGSWVVANGIGYGTYKYGNSKDNVINLQAVVEDASVVETGYDDIGYYMSGYNLTQLFSGSEGTLGIVTEATLKLSPKGIKKLLAYEFSSIDDMQKAITGIVQHPSIKPRNIAWCGKNRTITISLDGADGSIDLEVQSIDAMMEKIPAAKIDKDVACKVCKAICKPKAAKRSKAIVPVKNWKDLVSALDGQAYGTIADRSTAYVIAAGASDSLAEKAARFGGRSLECNSFKWTPSAKAEEERKDLSRKVTPEIISELENVMGKNNVTTNGVDLLLYSKDMAPLPKEAGIAFNNIPDVVVRPSSVTQISDVVRIAHRYGIPIVPRGNSSWGLGGCMPTNAGIVVDLSSKMNKIVEINTEELYVKVGAGCTWKELLEACMKKGYIIGSYPSSFPSATLGAWIATNGMGIGSYKYGAAKDNILNMEVILSDGTVLETGNNSLGTYRNGYNLNQIFSGSEGTLCVFGTVTFRIYPMGVIKPIAYCYEQLKDMHGTIQKIVNHPSIKPLHIAFSDELHFANQRKAGMDAPKVKNLLLVTLQGDQAFVDRDIAELDVIASELGGRRINDHIAEHEWEERCYEFRARRVGVGEIPAEVIVPVSQWGPFTDECYSGFEKMKMEAGGVIGVIVDRNTALFMPYYFKDDESLLGMTAFAFNFYLGDRAVEYSGRTTGFGVFCAGNRDTIHDASTVEYMRHMKTMLDPRDVINPGHLVCGKTRFGINMGKQLMGVGSTLMQTIKKLLPVNTTFVDNKKRFRYNELERRKDMDRTHKLGDGTE
ncbi:MAG: FAD-binding oxidoreductase [Candidatus Methanoplasma sp.]|jgi:glycolate oxidase|nr:FAD-binding oxidoreductase [Candidatus Methanoplasma sp.]